MSGATSLIAAIASWRNSLRPASFRGVGFYIDASGGMGGRRLAEHEFPLRETGSLEDLGKRLNRYKFKAWVVGDDYMPQRDALLSACQDYSTAAVLVHPYLGEITCRSGALTWTESKDRGGYCEFDLLFVVDDSQPSPVSTTDTVSALLSGVASFLTVAAQAYEEASLIASDPALLIGFAGGLLGDAANVILGLPASTVAGLASLAAAIYLTPSNDAETAGAVQACFDAAVANVLAQVPVAATADDPVLGSAPYLAPPADLTGGLASLAEWPPPSPSGYGPVLTIQLAQQAAIVALIQGNAVAAVAQIYAQTDFPTAQAATDARAQLLGMIDAQIQAAADAGQDSLYLAWQALAGLASADLIQRAQALPSIASYVLAASFPSLALAQRFYQDPSRAIELEQLNAVSHPLFMPFEGVRLNV
jgi:prophage DNA circulation protein